MEKEAFGTYEIAEICRVSPSTVGNWVEKGLLPTFTTGGGHRRVWTADLVDFLKKHNIPVPEELRTLTVARILIVDDEDQVRRVIKRYLHKLYPEVEIHEASDGFEAGQKVTVLLPSLVILDLKLPGVDGLKVCKMIRSTEKLGSVKILAISGHHPEESEKESLEAGADAFLAKPFDMEGLKEMIVKLLPAVGKTHAASTKEGGK